MSVLIDNQTACALCATDFTSPGDGFHIVIAAQLDSGKVRPVFRSKAVCSKCANPESENQLMSMIRRLPSVYVPAPTKVAERAPEVEQ